jgi:hypothetical protein
MLRTELLQMVAERIEEVFRPLLEEVATIKLLFGACYWVFGAYFC